MDAFITACVPEQMLAKSAYVRSANSADDPRAATGIHALRWHDGSPLDLSERDASAPPPPLLTAWEWPHGCVPYYTVPFLKRRAKEFTSAGSPGEIYRDQRDAIEEAMRLPDGCARPTGHHPRPSVSALSYSSRGHNSRRLPAQA